MRKKNKRKEPEFKKPFIVLSRKKIAAWLFLLFFLCAWMFVLGVLVGRGTAPVQFDISALEKKIGASEKDDATAPKPLPSQPESAPIKDKTELDFYEALEEDKIDTKVPALQKPETVEPKIDKPAESSLSRKTPKAASEKAEPQKPKSVETSPEKKSTEPKVAAVEKTHAAGPVYTIQAASLRDAKDADQLVQKLKKSGYPAYRAIAKIPGKGIWFRVRVGEYKSKSEAQDMIKKLKKDGLKPILVMK